jgi:amino acid transporter
VNLIQFLLGRPLRADEAKREEIGSSEGLAALSLDALSSVAYGPEAIALVLIVAGVGAMPALFPITVAIVVLLALLVLSYTQVIQAYPQGGGAYAVSRENLGRIPSHIAAASLIVDYTLTVAVSIAAGVASLTSAFPALLPHTTLLCLAVLALITYLNLRGVGESARAFLLPTFLFIVGTLAMIVVGLAHPGALHALPRPTHPISWGLRLKAFAAGCSALTGVEAIANGVPLFRPPRVQRAKRTEWMLGAILAAMLLGIAWLVLAFHLHPVANRTLLSSVTRAAVGSGWPFVVLSLATMAVLGLAANTSYGGFPLLASVLARDHFLPHLFAIRGDRLVYQYGIAILAVLSAILLVAVRGNTQALIPMFAIGVFTGFTLSQTGMVFHWWRLRPPGFWLRVTLNGLGALATGVATIIFVITKFSEGAWVVVVAVPLLVLLFRQIARYYRELGQTLRIGAIPPPVETVPRPVVIVPVANLSSVTARAIAEAKALSDTVIAITVEFRGEGERGPSPLEVAWQEWDPGVRLVVLKSQYQSIVRPLMRFINGYERRAGERIVVLIPEVVPRRFDASVLHNQMGILLASALRRRADVIVSILPFHVDP